MSWRRGRTNGSARLSIPTARKPPMIGRRIDGRVTWSAPAARPRTLQSATLIAAPNDRILAERQERDQLGCDPDQDVADLRRQSAGDQQPDGLDQAGHESGHQPGGQSGWDSPSRSSGEVADPDGGQGQHDPPQGQRQPIVAEDDDIALGEGEDHSDRRQVHRHDAPDQAEPSVAPQEGDPVRHYLFSGWPRRPDGRKISTSTRMLKAITSFSWVGDGTP